MYLRALGTLPEVEVHYGHYLNHKVKMLLAQPQPGGPKFVEVIKTEEKGSDVNLATHLISDAYERRCEPVSEHPYRYERQVLKAERLVARSMDTSFTVQVQSPNSLTARR